MQIQLTKNDVIIKLNKSEVDGLNQISYNIDLKELLEMKPLTGSKAGVK